MAGINNAITDILTKLNGTVGFARIFNNQFRYMETQQIESFPFPCSFLEVVMSQRHTQLASGYTESDVTFKVHLGAVEYDAMDGTLEQNKSIFALRDSVVRDLTYYQPTGCGRLMKVAENQDYEHTNVYHYTVEFICAFIDTTGGIVPYVTIDPTELELHTTIINL